MRLVLAAFVIVLLASVVLGQEYDDDGDSSGSGLMAVVEEETDESGSGSPAVPDLPDYSSGSGSGSGEEEEIEAAEIESGSGEMKEEAEESSGEETESSGEQEEPSKEEEPLEEEESSEEKEPSEETETSGDEAYSEETESVEETESSGEEEEYSAESGPDAEVGLFDSEDEEETSGSGEKEMEESLAEEEPTENVDEEPEESTAEMPVSSTDCNESQFGCCPDGSMYPAHGPDNLGCCASSEYGCCADNERIAEGPYGEGCDCKSTEFGCCPDEVTPARGADNAGCGCQYSPGGCCPDQNTLADGPGFEGCSCTTYEFGCCPDGTTVAQGSNMEGCPECNSEFGCCPDGVTARWTADHVCGCESSKYGCCLDGETEATGLDFQGCQSLPGEGCHLASDPGTCTEYVSKWFYDTEWGGCNRFWYGGCEPGQNHFDEEQPCKDKCVSPRGSGACFLKKIDGPCDGQYDEWYYDFDRKRCTPFSYSGCLGNDNRFLTKELCEDKCTERLELPACEKPMAEGACAGDFPRWFYDRESGQCSEFSYSGCRGNNNRFMTRDECEGACTHKAKALQTETVCKMYIENGNCNGTGVANSTMAKWGYDERQRRCVPFYFTGCEGNENNFDTRDACEAVCPTTFPAIVSFPRGTEILVERRTPELILTVSVKANPPPTVTWIRQGQAISEYDYRYEILPDYSLKVKAVSDMDGGEYTVRATNGIGEPATKSINVVVYPLYTKVDIDMEQSIFKPESDMTIPCVVKGYPPPEITWYKMSYRRGGRGKERVVEDRPRVRVETFQLTTTSTASNVVIRNVSEADSGNYRCEASSATFPPVGETQGVRVQYGPGDRCIDRPSYTHCDMVVKHKFCGNKYYGQYCCRSCTEAGFLPGGLE